MSYCASNADTLILSMIQYPSVASCAGVERCPLGCGSLGRMFSGGREASARATGGTASYAAERGRTEPPNLPRDASHYWAVMFKILAASLYWRYLKGSVFIRSTAAAVSLLRPNNVRSRVRSTDGSIPLALSFWASDS